MDDAKTNFKGRLIDTVRDHYNNSDKPLYLSRFGQVYPNIRDESLSYFTSIGSAIRSVGSQFLEIISPRNKAGGEIVVTPEVKDAILTGFEGLSADYSAAEAAFDRLPLPIRVAFCVKVEDQQQVMISVRPRYRFERIKKGATIKNNFILVEDKYRFPGLNLNDADAEDKHNLWRNFESWRQDNGLDLSIFESKTSGEFKDNVREPAINATSGALRRLIEAQSPELRDKIVIPADIILVLLEIN